MSGTKRSRNADEELSSDEILTIVRDIMTAPLTVKDKARVYRTKYPEFAERYEHLFNMACEPNFEFEKLEYMIRLREKVNTGRMTFENASKQVGQKMFDEYVKPMVDKQKM